ncbi:hypothetical protein PMT97_05820 [Enterococcus faecalis]|uniref:hypothetical protein n=1 Tax=Enterococcus faecalis TaxID=1351 RepID=UPI001143CABD|nr:hypothetical protein [Enterococcus faecalis]EGO8274588.1 hypothetical protein [Enterococcus faecalis]EGO9002588.1 hypothetical protein [Enterococcus faecalis]MDB1623615.1 hypothetical protein [Enterococcus faecalis]NSW11045.1 hypothetical protein [Enterococcus faecalis]TQB31967.1 hypothetical protein FKZ00_01265 [Enterococcus faecalis]
MKKPIVLLGLFFVIGLAACTKQNETNQTTTPTTASTTKDAKNDKSFERLTAQEGKEIDEMMEEIDYERPEVKVEGDALVYKGALYYSGLVKLEKLYKENPKVTRLKLESPGGVTLLGMSFGEFVHKNNLDVEVTGTVFSSAANYIFTAGKKVYLHKDSIIGFHGGEGDPTEPIEGMEERTKEEQKEYEANARRGYNWQTEFFKELGVNPSIVNLGQDKKYEKYSDEKIVGWTYTLEVFKKLGIKNIELVDGEWNTPTDMGDGESLFVIQANDIK